MSIETYVHEPTGHAVLVCDTSGYAIEMRHFDNADDAEAFLRFCNHQGVDPRATTQRYELREAFDRLHVCADCEERILVPSETRPTEQCAKCEEDERYDAEVAYEQRYHELVEADEAAIAMLPEIAANRNGGR